MSRSSRGGAEAGARQRRRGPGIAALALAGAAVGAVANGLATRSVPIAESVAVRADLAPEAAAAPAPAGAPGSPDRADRADAAAQESPRWGHNFYFTRAVYTGSRGGYGRYGRGAWSTDYPKADRQFLYVIDRMLPLLDAYEWENAVRLDDPELRKYPFLYALEVGYMRMTEAEVEGLRNYLEAGGFLIVDDFWGTRQWANFEREIRRVLPDRPIVELPLDHPIFHQFYDIEEILQVPSEGNARRGITWERDGYTPHVFGIHDDAGDLMVVINWNTDLGDAWEWAEQPYYPFEYSNFALQLGVNFIIYGLTH